MRCRPSQTVPLFLAAGRGTCGRVTETDPELAASFKQAMRRVASTVNVISICVGGEPRGITATAMSALALDPPSLLICINRAASLHASMEDMSHFAVNVLHRDQEDIAQMFADRSRQDLRFASGWDVDCSRPPLLADAQATFLCRRTDHHRFGTHSIFIGVVEEVTMRDEVGPLLYVDGSYGSAG